MNLKVLFAILWSAPTFNVVAASLARLRSGVFLARRETRPTPRLVKLGLLRSHSTVPPQILLSKGLQGRSRRHYHRRRFNSCKSCFIKLSLLGSQCTVSRQHPNSQCHLVKPGPRGPERRTVPLIQQSQRLLMKLSLLETKSRVPRQNPISQCPLVKLGLLSPVELDLFGPELVALPIQPLLPLLLKLDLQGLRSTAPRQNRHSQCRPVMLDLLSPVRVHDEHSRNGSRCEVCFTNLRQLRQEQDLLRAS